jgi:hypothetical protein
MKKGCLFSIGLLLLTLMLQAQSYIPERNNPKIKIKPVTAPKAYAFNLKDVHLLDGSPFKHAMDMDAAYLLLLAPKRLLYRFYQNAGLPVKIPFMADGKVRAYLAIPWDIICLQHR